MIITLPLTLPVKRQDFGVRSFDLAFANGDTGSSQVTVLAPPRHLCSLVSEERVPLMGEAAMWRSLVYAMDGQVNVLAVHDLLNPAPRGTARGAWTAAGAAAGATSMSINLGAAQANKTLLLGDWIGVNQTGAQRQLLHVQADAVANGAGVIVVQFKPALRVAVAAASAVVWDRPTCLMRNVATQNKWASEARTQGGFSLDLMESWE